MVLRQYLLDHCAHWLMNMTVTCCNVKSFDFKLVSCWKDCHSWKEISVAVARRCRSLGCDAMWADFIIGPQCLPIKTLSPPPFFVTMKSLWSFATSVTIYYLMWHNSTAPQLWKPQILQIAATFINPLYLPLVDVFVSLKGMISFTSVQVQVQVQVYLPLYGYIL